MNKIQRLETRLAKALFALSEAEAESIESVSWQNNRILLRGVCKLSSKVSQISYEEKLRRNLKWLTDKLALKHNIDK